MIATLRGDDTGIVIYSTGRVSEAKLGEVVDRLTEITLGDTNPPREHPWRVPLNRVRRATDILRKGNGTFLVPYAVSIPLTQTICQSSLAQKVIYTENMRALCPRMRTRKPNRGRQTLSLGAKSSFEPAVLGLASFALMVSTTAHHLRSLTVRFPSRAWSP